MKKYLLSAVFLFVMTGFAMAQDHHRPVHHYKHHHHRHHKPMHHH